MLAEDPAQAMHSEGISAIMKHSQRIHTSSLDPRAALAGPVSGAWNTRRKTWMSYQRTIDELRRQRDRMALRMDLGLFAVCAGVSALFVLAVY